MNFQLGAIDTAILILYGIILIGMGIYFFRKSKTSEQFMIAGRGIPAWAAGLAVMSAYISSISYIAVPGKAFDSNWHPNGTTPCQSCYRRLPDQLESPVQ